MPVTWVVPEYVKENSAHIQKSDPVDLSASALIDKEARPSQPAPLYAVSVTVHINTNTKIKLNAFFYPPFHVLKMFLERINQLKIYLYIQIESRSLYNFQTAYTIATVILNESSEPYSRHIIDC